MRAAELFACVGSRFDIAELYKHEQLYRVAGSGARPTRADTESQPAYPGSGGLPAALTSLSTKEVYTSFTLGRPLM